MKNQDDVIGLNVSALFRNYLNQTGLNWKECEKWGDKFNKKIEESHWLASDVGMLFELTFKPKAQK